MSRHKNPDPASALRHYFRAKQDLAARNPDKNDLTYKIFDNGLLDRLSNTNHLAVTALDAAEDMFAARRGLSREQSEALSELSRVDHKAALDWLDDYQERNKERVALGLIALWSTIEVADIPAPSPEMIEKARAAYNLCMPPGTRILQGTVGDSGPPGIPGPPGVPGPPERSDEAVLAQRRQARSAEMRKRMARHKEEERHVVETDPPHPSDYNPVQTGDEGLPRPRGSRPGRTDAWGTPG